jgi:hypothetical protein
MYFPDPKIIGTLVCQAAVFVYKDDPTVEKSLEDLQNMNEHQGGIRGEIHGGKESFLSGLTTWHRQVDPSNSFLCIYAHSDKDGITSFQDTPKELLDVLMIRWPELAAHLDRGVQYLWLIGCETQFVLNHWRQLQSSFLGNYPFARARSGCTRCRQAHDISQRDRPD